MSVLQEIASEESNLEMTPMIDVTFLLLIFFILTLKFKVLEGKLAAYLPKDVGAAPGETVEHEQIDVSVRVQSSGDKVYAAGDDRGQPWQGEAQRRFEFRPGSRVVEYQILSRKYQDLDGLRRRLNELYQSPGQFPAVLAAGRGTYYGDIIPVIDAIVEAGASQVTFAGELR